MCMEVNAHISAEQGKISDNYFYFSSATKHAKNYIIIKPYIKHKNLKLFLWLPVDFYSVVDEQKKQDMGCGEQKSKGSQHRNRTTFTPEQSRVLEHGNLKASGSSITMQHVYTQKTYSSVSLSRILTKSVCRSVHKRETV